MENKELVLKFDDKDYEFTYVNGVSKVTDSKMINELQRSNINNADSLLSIKSLNNLHISDVLQIKINVSKTGFFLANFEKDSLTEQKRKELIEKISKLKNQKVPSLENSKAKIAGLLKILNEESLIYVVYKQVGEIKIIHEIIEEIMSEQQLTFPLLVLSKEQNKQGREFVDKVHKRFHLQNLDFPILSTDLLFTALFGLLISSFNVIGIFEIMNKENIAIFVLVLSVIFFGVLSYIQYADIFRKKNHILAKIATYGVYMLVGTIIGTVAGFLVAKFAIKTDIKNFRYPFVMIVSTGITIGLELLSFGAGKLIHLITTKLIKK